MQVEDSVKTGILFVPPQSFLRKSWQKKYCALYKASNHGIQRLEIFDNEDAYSKLSPSRIISLTDCIKAIPAPQKQQNNVFEVRTSTNTYQFSSDSFQEMTEWLGVLQMVAFGLKRPPSVLGTDLQTPPKEEVKHEENLLYSSMDEPEVFCVKAVDTEAIARNNLRGDFKLIATPVSISLAEEGVNSRSGKILFTWPYRHIRRYGCNKDNFSFEAGRKCSSGEGIFTFSTKDSSRIFQSVDAHLTALKSSQSEAEVPSSPLPPSGNSYESVIDKGFSDQSSFFQRHAESAESLTGSFGKFSLGNRTPDSPRKKDTAAVQIRAEGSILETSHPVSKPPRKSKCKADIMKDGARNAMFFSTISGGHVGSHPNVYEVPTDLEHYQEVASEKSKNAIPTSRRGSSYGEMSSTQEPVYVVLEENACQSALTDELKQVLSCHKGNYANLDFSLSGTDTSGDRLYFSADSDSYDHLSLRNEKRSRSSSSSDDSCHLYGKLLPSKASSAAGEPQSSNMYGSLVTRKCDISIEPGSDVQHHSYINVSISKPLSSDETVALSDEPAHFLQNDAEYAQVLKKKSG